MEDSTVSRHIVTSKGHTCLRIPEPLRRDTVKPPALSLFHEETEVDYSSDENEQMCKETFPTSPVPSLLATENIPESVSPIQINRNIKRKLEFEALPHTTPEHGKASFKQLQSFWESQSGGKKVKKMADPTMKTIITAKKSKLCERNESPIDELQRRHSEIQKPENTPAKSAKQLALEYTQLVESVKRKSCANNEAVKEDANRKHTTDIDPVFEFNDEDVQQERMSLKEFRTQKCGTPMRASDKKGSVSPIVFDSQKVHVIRPKKTPIMKNVPGSANKQSRYSSSSETELKDLQNDSTIMPPPSDIPKCLSAKKIHTPSPNNSPKWKKSAERSCQPRWITEPEYSPNDLTPPGPNTGVKRKRNCKKRLLSMDASNYSLLFSLTDLGADSNTECSVTTDNDSFEKTNDSHTDISLSEISAIKPPGSSSFIMPSGNKAEILVSASKEIPPVDVKGRSSEDSFASCIETSATVQLPSTEISLANQEKDSFLDLTVNKYHKNDKSVVNINNLSAIEPADRNADGHMISFEFSSPQIVGVSGGRKRLLLDKAYTTLNESVLSDMEISMVNPEPVAEVCDAVSKMAGKIVGFDDSRISVDETQHASQKEEDDYTDLEHLKETPVNDFENDSVAHGMMTVSASNEENPVSNSLGGNENIVKETIGTFELTSICKRNDTSGESDSSLVCVDKNPETDQSDTSLITPSDSFCDNSNSLSTEYGYTLNSPPALQIDLSAVGDPSPQTGSILVIVTDDTQYEPSGDIINLDLQMSGQVRPVKHLKSLKDLSIENLGNARSQIYQTVMQQKMSVGVATYLSVPLVIDANISVDIDSQTETQTRKNHFSYLADLQSELKDPCYSPNLLCDESPDFTSISNKVPPSGSFLCWSPTLSESDDSDSFIYSSSDESCYRRYSSCIDDDPEYINALFSSRKDLKRPRRLVFESDEDDSDCYSPSPKIPKTPLTSKQFEFPCNSDNEKNVTTCDQIDNKSVKCAQSLETQSDSGEMKDLMEIEAELLERSSLPDIDYPDLLNNSVAYLNKSDCFAPSTTESARSDSDSSLESKESADYMEYVKMDETFPVYTQESAEFSFPNHTTSMTSSNPSDVLTNQCEKDTVSDEEIVRNLSCALTDILTSQCAPDILSDVASVQGETDIISPTSLISVPSSIQNSACMPNTISTQTSGCISPKPLDLRISNKQIDQGLQDSGNGNLRNGLANRVITTSVSNPGGYQIPEYVAEPQVAILETNNSDVWKEIGVGNVSYSYSPSKESSQYAMNCYNNAVFGCYKEQLPVNGPDYIDTSLQENLYINNSVYCLPGYDQRVYGYGQADPQCVQNNMQPTYDMVEEQRQMYYNSIPVIDGITVPLKTYEPNTRNPLPVIEGITVPLASHSFPQTFISPPHEQFNDKTNKVVNAVNESTNDVFESSGNTSASSSSGSSGPSSPETEPDIMKHMEEVVRNRLIEKAGNQYITADRETFELSENLKHVRPYVISGWITSTYLMALAKKDLVNDMFENALDEKGEIQQWIVENCRSTTPAVLARDLVFRLFTLEELENLNLVALARKKRFKAIRKCVEKLFPVKQTRKTWQSCLNLIKSSVGTLFKHRLRQVQNFLVMHVGL